MTKQILVFLYVLVAASANAQQSVQDVETRLAAFGEIMINGVEESTRLAANDSFTDLLDDNLKFEIIYKHPLEAVKNLSKLTSPDGNFRIYSWAVPLKNREYAFFGRLVLKTETGFKVVNLTDGQKQENIEYQLLKAENWFGAVYYEIVKTKQKKEVYYTLLGYRPSRNSYNQKVIEVLNLDRNTVRFGDKIFETPKIGDQKYKRPPQRLVLRYSPKVSATIKYYPKEKQIVLDHLAVPDASQRGQWQFYGPDFSYDALMWEKGKWRLQEEIKVNNTATKP